MKLVKEVPMEACRACMDKNEDYCDHDDAKLTRKHVLILPGCCEASRKALFPRVSIDLESVFEGEPDDTSKLKARWTIPLASFYDDRVQQAWQGTDYKLPTPPTHCPFCGTGLPEIVRDPTPPSPIDSHDDCGHCGCGWPRSYGMCACWPRAAVFTTENDVPVTVEEAHKLIVEASASRPDYPFDDMEGMRCCPKCEHWSGDSWRQCRGQCPMPESPHFDKDLLLKLGRELRKKPPAVP